MITDQTVKYVRAPWGPPSHERKEIEAGLVLGSLAGPLFTALVLVQIAIVPWFDITRLPISVLSIGEIGFVQKAAFMIAGGLTVVAAFALRSALRGTPAGRFGPLLIGAFGLGLALSGLFDVDPSEGAPPESIPVSPADYSWHMYAHNLSSMLAFVCLSVACFVFVRRFQRQRAFGWAAASGFVGTATFVLFFLPVGSPSLRLAIATLFMFAWLTAVLLRVRAAIRREV
jgi:hypothetical membrane protein